MKLRNPTVLRWQKFFKGPALLPVTVSVSGRHEARSLLGLLRWLLLEVPTSQCVGQGTVISLWALQNQIKHDADET